MITAEERVSWTNSTERPVHELWFHLCWNGSQNNMTDFLVEGTQRRGRIIRQNCDDSAKFGPLMHFSLRDLIIRNPSLKKYHEWSEFS